jgi:hypothetical protein
MRALARVREGLEMDAVKAFIDSVASRMNLVTEKDHVHVFDSGNI